MSFSRFLPTRLGRTHLQICRGKSQRQGVVVIVANLKGARPRQGQRVGTHRLFSSLGVDGVFASMSSRAPISNLDEHFDCGGRSVWMIFAGARKGPLPLSHVTSSFSLLRHFVILTSVLAAVGCSVGTQYGVKVLVDCLSRGAAHASPWVAFALLCSLIAADNLLWRVAGWIAGASLCHCDGRHAAGAVSPVDGAFSELFHQSIAGHAHEPGDSNIQCCLHD